MEINELLKIEKDFQEANRNKPLIINQYGEMEYTYTNEDLSFLMKGYLRKHYEATTDDTWYDLKAKGLNEFEALMLVCFEGCEFDNAHNSMSDVMATLKCFKEMIRVGVIY